MFRWLLNWLNPHRNPSNVFTDTPGGVDGMTWFMAKEWVKKGYKVRRNAWPKGVFVTATQSKIWWNNEDSFRLYYPTPADEISCDWFVVKEGV